jgi:hypothetical protein
MNSHTPVVEQLIAAGAALDVQDNEGYGRCADCIGRTLFNAATDFSAGTLRSSGPRRRATRSWSSCSSTPAPTAAGTAALRMIGVACAPLDREAEMCGRCDAKAVHQVRQMERSPSTLDLLWVGLRGPVRRRPALRTRGVAHAPGGPSSSMCAVQATLALARKVRVALLFLESNCTWNRIDRKNPTANGPPPKKAHRDWTQRALNSAAPAVLSMRAHRFVRMAWQHAPSCARVQPWSPVSPVHPAGSIRLARGYVCAAVGAARDAHARAASRATAAYSGLGRRHAAHSLRCGSDTVAVGAARDDRRGDGFRAQLRASSETAKRQIMHMLIDRLLNHVA